MSKVKTPHDVMRAVLNDEEYANFCGAWKAYNANFSSRARTACLRAAERGDPATVVLMAFPWKRTEQGEGYWREMSDRLRKAEL